MHSSVIVKNFQIEMKLLQKKLALHKKSISNSHFRYTMTLTNEESQPFQLQLKNFMIYQ